MHRTFSRMADTVTDWTGGPWASLLAVLFVSIWGVGLVHFGVRDQNYEYVINTGTSIVTFLMVFLIQHSTNRGSRALQLKLDALIASQDRAENKLVGAEELSDSEIRTLQGEHREQVRQREKEIAGAADASITVCPPFPDTKAAGCVVGWQKDDGASRNNDGV